MNQEIEKLKELGYHWKYDADSYRVWYKENFISGAGVKLPRSKPLHCKYRDANLKDNLESCIRACQNYQAKLEKENNNETSIE